MNPVFVICGKTLCIRRLKQTDLQYAYYEVMSLLSEVDRTTCARLPGQTSPNSGGPREA